MKPAARQAPKPPAAQRTRRAAKAKPAPLVSPELLARAQAAGVDVSAVLEQAIAAVERARTLAEIELAVEQTNSIIDQYGLPSDQQRLF